MPVGNQTAPRPYGRTSTHRPTGTPPVANIKSQIKRNRQTEVRRVRNRAVSTELKTRIKNAVEAAETGPRRKAAKILPVVISAFVDARGVFHERKIIWLEVEPADWVLD